MALKMGRNTVVWIGFVFTITACPGPYGPGADVIVPPPVADIPATEIPDGNDSWEFTLGVNVTGKNQPQFFSPLADDEGLEIEYGPQGLWMVVLAFKTQGLLNGQLFIDGEIFVGDTLLGRLTLAKQQLSPGGDGYSYYYNYYLVVDDETTAGETATLHFYVLDEEGDEVKIIQDVTLTGGMPG
jgi:hypothetical protein